MEKKSDFDYAKVPYDYAHCFNHDCPRAAECLRHLTGLNIPKDVPLVRCVSPSVWPTDADKCPHYRTTKKITLAWGVSHMAEEAPTSRPSPSVTPSAASGPRRLTSASATTNDPSRPTCNRRLPASSHAMPPAHSPDMTISPKNTDFHN